MQSQTIDFLSNLVGIIGVSLILLAYFLIQLEKVTNKDLIYSVMNLIGSVLLLISLLRFWNLPSVVIEFFWMAISLYGIYNAISRSKPK